MKAIFVNGIDNDGNIININNKKSLSLGRTILIKNLVYNIYGIIKTKNNTLFVIFENEFACFVDAKCFSIIDPTLYHPVFFGHHISQSDVIFVYGSNRMATDMDYLLQLYQNEEHAICEFIEYINSLTPDILS